MKQTDDSSLWHEINFSWLMGVIGTTRRTLEQYAAVNLHGQMLKPQFPMPVLPACPTPLPRLEQLCQHYKLTAFQRQVLILCAGVELDPYVANLCAQLNHDPAKCYPTFDLALRYFAGSWSDIAPQAPLRYGNLITCHKNMHLLHSPLAIPERILFYLTNTNSLGEQLANILLPIATSPYITHTQQRIAETVYHLWQQQASSPIVQLINTDTQSGESMAAQISHLMKVSLFKLNVCDLPDSLNELVEYRHLLEQEIMLTNCLYLLDCSQLGQTEGDGYRKRMINLLARIYPKNCLLTADKALTWLDSSTQIIQ
jgi:hypothetical protein